MIFNSILQLVGNTPLYNMQNYCKKHSLNANIYAKLEYFNPTGSVKDRAVKAMIEDGEKRGILKAGSVIVEATSGNTGIALAAIGSVKGYRVIIVMPQNMSLERRKFIENFGGEVVLTDKKEGMQGAINMAEELKRQLNAVSLSQFTNTANVQAHTLTAQEICRNISKIDYFVCGIGTAGTISGVGKYLKNVNKNIQIIGVEPLKSCVLSGGEKGMHAIQGIGAGFVPPLFDRSICDRIITVSDQDAFKTKQEICKTHSLFVGISSGAALFACRQLATTLKTHANIVTLFPDSADRYLSQDQ